LVPKRTAEINNLLVANRRPYLGNIEEVKPRRPACLQHTGRSVSGHGRFFDTIRCSGDLNSLFSELIVMTAHRWLPFMAGIVFAIWGIEQALAVQPNGYPVSNVNLRAGPDTEFPVIVTVPNRAPIAILGCLAAGGYVTGGSHAWRA
jgi:hypothetical protein